MRSKSWLGGASMLVLVLACAGAWWKWHRPAAAPVKAAAPPPASAVYEGNEVMLSGRVEPQHTIAVPAPIDGILEDFAVQTGQEVFEGQLLATIRNQGLASISEAAEADVNRIKNRIDNMGTMLLNARLEASRARSEVTRAQSDLDRLERIWQRQKVLFAEGATPRLIYEKSERDYLKVKSNYDSLDLIAKASEERASALQREYDNLKKVLADKEADADQAKAHMQSGEIHSPVDGLVVALRGQPGDELTLATRDLVLIATDISQLKVVLNAEPPVIRRLRGGEPALVQVPELQSPPLPGEVKSVEGDQITVEFGTPDPQIRPGLNAQVRIRLM